MLKQISIYRYKSIYITFIISFLVLLSLALYFWPKKAQAFACSPMTCPLIVPDGGQCVTGTCTGDDCYENACFISCAGTLDKKTPDSCGPTAGGGSPPVPPKCSPRTKENQSGFPSEGISIWFTGPAGTVGEPWAVPSDKPLKLEWDYTLGGGLAWLDKIDIRWQWGGDFYDTSFGFGPGYYNIGGGFGKGSYGCVNEYPNNYSVPAGTICKDDCQGYFYPFDVTSLKSSTEEGSIGGEIPAILPPKSYTISVEDIKRYNNWIGNYVRFQILAYWTQAVGGTAITSVYKDELQDIFFKDAPRNQVNAKSSYGRSVSNPTFGTSDQIVFSITRNETINSDSPQPTTYTITNLGIVNMIWKATDYQPLSGKDGFSVIPIDPTTGTLAEDSSVTPTLNLTGVPADISDTVKYKNNDPITIGNITVSAENEYVKPAIGSPKTIPVKVIITQITAGFKVLFAAENIMIGSRSGGLTIQYDSAVVDNPPPGFAELLAPYWSETNP